MLSCGAFHFLTTGSVLYDPETKEWAKDVTFDPGCNGEPSPKKVNGIGVLSTKGWTESGDPSQDLGLVALDKAIGERTGWYGVMISQDASFGENPLEVRGYDMKKRQYLCRRGAVAVEPESIRLATSLPAGPFGNPVCLMHDEVPMIVVWLRRTKA
ncbi:MAG: hypothetical protein WCN27_00140 [Alphaproteobacteria bacterium]